jgi:DNA recombination protein RmuC
MQNLGSVLATWPAPLLALVFLLSFIALIVAVVWLPLTLSKSRHYQRLAAQQQHETEQLAQSLGDALEANSALETTIASNNSQLQDAKMQQGAFERENHIHSESIAALQQQLSSAQQSLSNSKADYSALEAKSIAEYQAMEEKLALIQQSREQLSREFESIANKIFEDKTQRFSKSSQQQLDATLAPLKGQLDNFRQRVDTIYSEEGKERHLLHEQIKQLRAESFKIREDATNLTNALKLDNKTQGNWGELTLVRALELCGLREPQEYETQVVVCNDDNAKHIPDVIVHLPGGKDIIIDSKVSLIAYTRYFEADEENAREQALKEHVQSIRQHIRQLSDKSYQHLPAINTLDYVMLYIPIEGASAMAMQAHQGLWEEAYAKNIVLVSPTNLLAILRSVETIWRHEKQNRNAEEIARQAGNLHDKFLGLIKSLEDVGKNLDLARKSYDNAYGQLTTGRGNLISRVQKLETLGAKTKKEIPAHLQIAAGVENGGQETNDTSKLATLASTTNDD